MPFAQCNSEAEGNRAPRTLPPIVGVCLRSKPCLSVQRVDREDTKTAKNVLLGPDNGPRGTRCPISGAIPRPKAPEKMKNLGVEFARFEIYNKLFVSLYDFYPLGKSRGSVDTALGWEQALRRGRHRTGLGFNRPGFSSGARQGKICPDLIDFQKFK